MLSLQKNSIRLSIILPSYKEANLIADTLKSVHSYLLEKGLHKETEVIVVAANGGDDTASIAKGFERMFEQLLVIEPGPKVGKGRDVKLGMQAARGRSIFFTDADLATPIDYLEPALRVLESGQADIVIGTRNLWRIHKGFMRKTMSVFANWIVRFLLLPGVPDSQCGFKGFTSEAADTCFSRTTINGWAFDMEVLAIARQHNKRINYFAIDRWSDPKLEAGLVGESPIQASIITFKELWRIRKQKKKGLYI